MKTRAKVLADDKGNRVVFPNFIVNEENPDTTAASVIIVESMMWAILLGMTAEKEWLELDTESFQHVRIMVAHPSFRHGGSVGYLIGGPRFDEIAAEQKEHTG